MRRLLVTGLLVFLVVVPGAIGVVTADWPFWKRVLSMPRDPGEWPDAFYQPTAAIPGRPSEFFPLADAATQTLDPAALAQAANWAEANNSSALLVLHRGVVQLERYYGEMRADTLFSGRAMTRSIVGMAIGLALADGKITTLDAPVSTWLDEWRDDPRGRITLRQLLQNTSGLEEVPLSAPTRGDGAWGWWAQLPALVTSKNSRLSLGADFAGAALAFNLEHEPGARFNFSNANSQLAGVILERATGEPYETYVNARIWSRIGAGAAEFYLDRRNGMPAVYCCFRATPRDYLRLGALLVSDGAAGSEQVLPPGWVREMATGSRANPLYGLQIWAGRAQAGTREYTPGSGRGVPHVAEYVADDVIWMEGGGGRTLWAIPSQQLVILRLGKQSPTWDASYLPNVLSRAVRD
jgi:CubicO group peptidase (beta-lactamase class C family)